jgi:hypothetical protein
MNFQVFLGVSGVCIIFLNYKEFLGIKESAQEFQEF